VPRSFGVHRARTTQLKAARLSGVLQLLLAAGALAASAISMWLLARHRGRGAHMEASWIFTTNDVIANLGVIVAAVLVRFLNSPLPDLVVATVIALVVLNGAIRILWLTAE